MRAFDALVQGRLNFAGPDGVPLRIPRGRCTIEAHVGYASVSWTDGGLERTVVIAARQFEEHLESGAVLIVDANPYGRPQRGGRSSFPA